MDSLNEQDEDEIEYGKWIEHTADEALAETRETSPKLSNIWPHWNDGVPTKLRRYVRSPTFSTGNVYHRQRDFFDTLELEWHGARTLTELEAKPHLLPGNYASTWSGVYRIFVLDTAIDRCCGKDRTGTLYIGLAGTGARNSSNLRSRIKEILNTVHHATACWSFNGPIARKFPWKTLAINWAYTDERLNYRGETVPGAFAAENFLLANYNDSFGELPPLNLRR